MSNDNLLYLILFIVFVLFSAFFSAAETSLTSLSKLRIKHLVSIGAKGALRIEKVMTPRGRFLAAILLVNDLLNVAAAAMATVIAVSIFGEALGAVIATIGATIIILIIGDVIPKTYAEHNSEKVALFLAGLIQFVIWIFYPFVWLLNKIGLGVTHMIAEDDDRPKLVDEEELHTAINVGEAEGVWEEDEAEMLHNALEFVDRPVREVMTPRPDIAWIEKGITLRQFLNIYRDCPHSRFPVYEGTTDNVSGILNIKDVLLAQATEELTIEKVIDDLIRPAYFVPATKHLGELLSEMKETNNGLAIIVDEYGGVAGIITQRQMTEEIVGSLGDELADDDADIVTINANTFEIDSGIRIEDANEELGLSLPPGGYETIAGFVMAHLGRIPKQGEQLRYKNLTFYILEMRGLRIEKIRVTKEHGTAQV